MWIESEYQLTKNVISISAMIASIIKTVQIRVLVSIDSDPTVATVNLERWLYIETYLVIITTSLPFLRSLIRTTKSNSENSYMTKRSSRIAPSRSVKLSVRSGNRESISASSDRRVIIQKTFGSGNSIVADTANDEVVDFYGCKHSYRSFSCDSGSNDLP